jgi:hypothetical protein
LALVRIILAALSQEVSGVNSNLSAHIGETSRENANLDAAIEVAYIQEKWDQAVEALAKQKKEERQKRSGLRVGVSSGNSYPGEDDYIKDSKREEDDIHEVKQQAIITSSQNLDKDTSNYAKVYAKLCEASYLLNIERIQDQGKDYGFNLIGSQGASDKGGYFGFALVNEQSKEVVITHRGTDTDYKNKKMFGIFKDLKDDLGIIYGKVPSQIAKAERFSESVYEKYPDYKVTHIGHSLGGVYSELMAAKHDKLAYSFDAPGTKPLIAKFAPEVAIKPENIKIFKSIPNAINTYGENIHNNITQVGIALESKDTTYHGYLKATTTLHAIKDIAKHIDKQEIRQFWPSGDIQGYCEFRYGSKVTEEQKKECQKQINEEINSIQKNHFPL